MTKYSKLWIYIGKVHKYFLKKGVREETGLLLCQSFKEKLPIRLMEVCQLQGTLMISLHVWNLREAAARHYAARSVKWARTVRTQQEAAFSHWLSVANSSSEQIEMAKNLSKQTIWHVCSNYFLRLFWAAPFKCFSKTLF